MERQRESVRLRAYGQRDPLVEYKIEAQRMYGTLLDTVAARVADVIFKIRLTQPTTYNPQPTTLRENRGQTENLPGTAAEETSSSEPAQAHGDDTGRNDPCPCGAINPKTGEVYKYKKCGLIDAPHHQK
jgi:preprotein translocase subunit SecA